MIISMAVMSCSVSMNSGYISYGEAIWIIDAQTAFDSGAICMGYANSTKINFVRDCGNFL